MDCSLPGSSVHGILRQEYWSGLPRPSPAGLPDLRIEPWSPALQADSVLSELNQASKCRRTKGLGSRLLLPEMQREMMRSAERNGAVCPSPAPGLFRGHEGKVQLSFLEIIAP